MYYKIFFRLQSKAEITLLDFFLKRGEKTGRFAQTDLGFFFLGNGSSDILGEKIHTVKALPKSSMTLVSWPGALSNHGELESASEF